MLALVEIYAIVKVCPIRMAVNIFHVELRGKHSSEKARLHDE